VDVVEVVERDPQLLKGVLPMLVLTLLDREESYGYELVTRLQTAGLHGIATGTVYPVLTRLEREGRLTSRLVASAAGPARKYYRPTPAGLALLADARRAWADLADVVSHLLPDPEESR
jgi:PadR family transcriptional regulator PadR